MKSLFNIVGNHLFQPKVVSVTVIVVVFIIAKLFSLIVGRIVLSIKFRYEALGLGFCIFELPIGEAS